MKGRGRLLEPANPVRGLNRLHHVEDVRSRHGRDVEDIPAPVGEREPPSSITRGVNANIAIFAPDQTGDGTMGKGHRSRAMIEAGAEA